MNNQTLQKAGVNIYMNTLISMSTPEDDNEENDINHN